MAIVEPQNKKFPNCGACQECAARPYPGLYPYPWPYVQRPPYQVGGGQSSPNTAPSLRYYQNNNDITLC